VVSPDVDVCGCCCKTISQQMSDNVVGQSDCKSISNGDKNR